jgi:hypothetical protein
MRKCVWFLLFISSFQLNGQVRTGLRGGLNRSNLVERWDQPDGRITGAAVTRLNGGFLFEIPLEEQWFLHTGPYYSGKGANMHETDSTRKKDSVKIRLNYIELPVMIVYKFPGEKEHQFILSSGPYLGYGFNGSMAWKGGRPATQRHIHRKSAENYRRFELGWMISAHYEIESRYGLRLDFSKSLLNIQHPESWQKSWVMGFSFYWYLKKIRNE